MLNRRTLFCLVGAMSVVFLLSATNALLLPAANQTFVACVASVTVAAKVPFSDTVALAPGFGLNKPGSMTGACLPVSGLAAHCAMLDAYVLPLGPICTLDAARAGAPVTACP